MKFRELRPNTWIQFGEDVHKFASTDQSATLRGQVHTLQQSLHQIPITIVPEVASNTDDKIVSLGDDQGWEDDSDDSDMDDYLDEEF